MSIIEQDRAKHPIRNARFEDEPGYYEPASLWLYGNVRLLHGQLACIQQTLGQRDFSPSLLEAIERDAEQKVLAGKILVCGVHNPAHQRAAIVPLRWGSPRIVVVSGGFLYHLGLQLRQEPFRAARLWRYEWDPKTDLILSRRDPERLPTFAHNNPTVDRLIQRIADREVGGLLFEDSKLGILSCSQGLY